MGGLSGMLGLAGGAAGTGFSAPNGANIINPSNKNQADMSFNDNQHALQQQQNLLNALQGQNGLQNQSNVFNQLQGVANGTGPNPAQAQLAQATGANTANTAALMAGQRGAGANAGLIARQAAQQGAANQQNAAGQAATLQANQSLNALNSLGGMANQQVANQQAQTNQIAGSQQGEQQNILNSIAQQNNANVNMQSNVNSANAGLAQTGMGQQGNIIGNIAGGIGSALHLAEGGKIKNVDYDPNNNDPVFQDQIQTPVAPMAPVVPMQSIPSQPAMPSNGPSSGLGKFLQGMSTMGQAGTPGMQSPQGPGMFGQTLGKGIGAGINALFSPSQKPITGISDNTSDYSDKPMMAAAEGGKVPALVSPGEQYLPPEEVKAVAKGKKDPLEAGERIAGKPTYPGNDYRNDTVKKDLKVGGLVIPNSIMQAKNPHFEAMKFVHAHIAKSRGKLPKKA